MVKPKTPNISEETVRRHLSYDPDTGEIISLTTRNSVRAGDVCGCIEPSGYIRIGLCGERILAHRLAWFLHFGEWPDQQIDHRNRIRSDNRLVNLRDVNAEANAHNSSVRKNCTSGVTGVRWRPHLRQWQATLSRRGRRASLGHFKTIEQATAARKQAEADWAVQVSVETA